MLSGTTNELIQELCAKCICNVTYSIKHHKQLIKRGLLQLIMVISLVRTISPITKQLCARALLNLLTDDNLPALKEASAIRIFGTLSYVDNIPTQNICARGFLIFTATEDRRLSLKDRPAIMHALFSMVSKYMVNVLYRCIDVVYMIYSMCIVYAAI